MSITQDRIKRGLCPECGKEAAPYYLCADCRFKHKIGRMLRRLAKAGALARRMEGREAWWSIGDREKFADVREYASPKEGDKRCRPRLGKIPADVEQELITMIGNASHGMHINDIVEAWGRLRETRKHGSLTGDMWAIIRGRRKMADKLARRAARARFPA